MTESSLSTDAPLSRALALARDAVADGPAGLLTDFDGTISPIVADPTLATLVEGASGALEALTRRLAVVAVITGRAPLDARQLTGVPELLIIGNHGIEWLEPGAVEPVSSSEAAAIRERMARLIRRAPPMEGTFVEDKGVSATVHYRAAPDPDEARDRLVEAFGEPGDGIEVRHGRMSVELRPTGLADKGVAAREVVERYSLRGVVVMGDDLTDLDMFEAVRFLRDEGRVRAAIIGVGGADRELRPEVAAASDVVLADPAEAAAFLVALSRPAVSG